MIQDSGSQEGNLYGLYKESSQDTISEMEGTMMLYIYICISMYLN